MSKIPGTTDRIQFSKKNDQLVWRLPIRELDKSQREIVYFEMSFTAAVIVFTALFGYFFAAHAKSELDGRIDWWAVFFSSLAFVISTISAVALVTYIGLLSGRSHLACRVAGKMLVLSEAGSMLPKRKIQVDQVNELIIKDSVRSLRYFHGWLMWHPKAMPAVIARTNSRDHVVCYGYPLHVTRSFGKQLATQLGKKWVEIGGYKGGPELTIDNTDDPLQPANSRINCIVKGKSIEYSVSSSGLKGTAIVSTVACLALAIFAGIMSWRVASWPDTINPLFLAPLTACFACLGGVVWNLMKAFERTLIQVDQKSLRITETSFLGAVNNDFALSRISAIYLLEEYHNGTTYRADPTSGQIYPCGVGVEMNDHSTFEMLGQLGSRDLFWICFQLNQDVFGKPRQNPS